VVLGYASGTLEVRDLRTHERVATLRGHAGRVFGCAVSPDGLRVISASEDETIKVWSLQTGALQRTLYGTSRFRCVAATNELICAGDEDGNLWMLAANEVASDGCEPPKHSGPAAAPGRKQLSASSRRAPDVNAGGRSGSAVISTAVTDVARLVRAHPSYTARQAPVLMASRASGLSIHAN
jgi:hypothetical protein